MRIDHSLCCNAAADVAFWPRGRSLSEPSKEGHHHNDRRETVMLRELLTCRFGLKWRARQIVVS